MLKKGTNSGSRLCGYRNGALPARIAKALQPETYFRKLEVPGVIIDRPGVSDRGVVAPVTGIVTRIHAYPGNTIEPTFLADG